MRIVATLIGIVSIAVWTGCSNPAKDFPAAKVGPATSAEAESANSSDTAGTPFVIGPETSKVGFIGSKVTGKHEGGFRKFTGELRVVEGRLADAGAKVTIDMDSLWTDDDRLTGHLKTPDFFDVATYPTATFESTKVEPNDGGSTLTGNLTLHGVTKTISFPADIQVSDKQVTLHADFSLNRFDFDIKFPGKTDDLIRKEVVIKLAVTARPSAAGAGDKKSAE